MPPTPDGPSSAPRDGSGRPARRGAPQRSGRSGGDRGRSRGASTSGEDVRRSIPGGAREPIGRDRASTRADAPPRPPRPSEAAPPRPPLPADEEAVLPRGVRREIERALGPGPRSRDVCLALSIGSEAIEEDEAQIALEVLTWAKHEAPRVAAVREAYGVALYLAERFDDALSELQAYRRLTGRVDQNHLIADCLRALGRDLDRITESTEALLEDLEAPEERRAEAAIIWAAALADAGNLGPGRAVLRQFLQQTPPSEDHVVVRIRWFAAELARRANELDEAIEHLRAIVAIDPEYLEAERTLDGLLAQR